MHFINQRMKSLEITLVCSFHALLWWIQKCRDFANSFSLCLKRLFFAYKKRHSSQTKLHITTCVCWIFEYHCIHINSQLDCCLAIQGLFHSTDYSQHSRNWKCYENLCAFQWKPQLCSVHKRTTTSPLTSSFSGIKCSFGWQEKCQLHELIGVGE